MAGGGARPGPGDGVRGPLPDGYRRWPAAALKDLYLGEFASVSALAAALSDSGWAAEDLAQNAVVVMPRPSAHRRRRRHS
jgi:hypothetical protein